MAFQSSLLGGVGVVEVAVGTVAAAVLIRRNIEPSHFGFLHAVERQESGAASNAGCLLSLAMHGPGRLPQRSRLLYPGNNTQRPSVSFSQSNKNCKKTKTKTKPQQQTGKEF